VIDSAFQRVGDAFQFGTFEAESGRCYLSIIAF
jgi:hypothetical protein